MTKIFYNLKNKKLKIYLIIKNEINIFYFN